MSRNGLNVSSECLAKFKKSLFPVLYPLKTSENLRFSGGIEIENFIIFLRHYKPDLTH